MTQVLAGNKIKLDSGQIVQGEEYGWYDSRRLVGGVLLNPGEYEPGKVVSKEVAAQTDPNNPAYIEEQRRKAGLSPALPSASAPPAPSAGIPGAPTGTTSPSVAPQVPNLTDLYGKLFQTPEIKAKGEEIAKLEKERDAAISGTQSNPWFGQATRAGKIAGIKSDAERELTRVGDELARLQADAQIQYNVQTNQYTLDRQAYQDNLDQFNKLLSLGAFDKASGSDIAQWSSTTGLSTSVIDSMVKTAQKKALTLQTYDDGTNVYVVALDEEGNVTKKTLIGKSKPTTTTTTKNIEAQFLESAITVQGKQTSAGWVGQFPLLVAQYAPFMSLQDIYKLYMESDLGKRYGAPAEKASDIQEIYDTYRGNL